MMNKCFICVILFYALIKADSLESLPRPENLTASVQQNSIRAAVASGLLPGGGQFMQKRYFKAGTFLAFEAVSGAVFYHWYQSDKYWSDQARIYRTTARLHQGIDSAFGMEESFLAKYSAKVARYRMYNSLSLMAGGYVYNILDAVNGTLLESSSKRDPVVAGWLAAIPGLGLGQVYNGKLSKAGMVLMGQITLGVMAINNHRLMTSAEKQNARILKLGDSELGTEVYDEYKAKWDSHRNSAFRKRNTYLWYSLIFYFVNIFDAVVDAHLSDYNGKMRVYPDLQPHSGGAQLNLNVNF